MKKYLGPVFFLTLLIVSSTECYSQEIGGGYSCSDSKIIKKNREVKLSKAKSDIQNKIAAVKGTSQRAKDKRADLKQIKSNLTACVNGTFVPSTPGTVPAEIIFHNDTFVSGGNTVCVRIALARFQDIKGAKWDKIVYGRHYTEPPLQQSKVLKPPFDDVYKYQTSGVVVRAPAGMHQIYLGSIATANCFESELALVDADFKSVTVYTR